MVLAKIIKQHFNQLFKKFFEKQDKNRILANFGQKQHFSHFWSKSLKQP